MNESEIKQKLIENGLETYVSVFEENHLFDEKILSRITNEDYISIGIKALGDRKKLLELFANSIESSKSETQRTKTSRKNKVPMKIIGPCIFILLVFFTIFVTVKIVSKSNYSENLNILYSKISKSSSEAEECINLIHAVWNNAIFEKYDPRTNKYTKPSLDSYSYLDFNSALKKLFDNQTFKNNITKLENESDEISKLMKEMINPPDQFKDAYLKLYSCYEDYIKLVNLAVNPTGNLNSYTKSINDLDSSLASKLKSLELYLK